ncbi:hypothetical protein K227x_44160 [Rubripirellula lacrimiformis]|uniref:Uncharacterized protein n=1 Tax=Rubripirellula lacrimiformis TaxID=1930273 RepID=A0A517NFU3_9BACT|nr:hypothetical protein [Rubripirellula lacrimiformis]QDT06009.1 hypothetical protein K227x_44160 [Rubripirellula lacrimiformis]
MNLTNIRSRFCCNRGLWMRANVWCLAVIVVTCVTQRPAPAQTTSWSSQQSDNESSRNRAAEIESKRVVWPAPVRIADPIGSTSGATQTTRLTSDREVDSRAVAGDSQAAPAAVRRVKFVRDPFFDDPTVDDSIGESILSADHADVSLPPMDDARASHPTIQTSSATIYDSGPGDNVNVLRPPALPHYVIAAPKPIQNSSGSKSPHFAHDHSGVATGYPPSGQPAAVPSEGGNDSRSGHHGLGHHGLGHHGGGNPQGLTVPPITLAQRVKQQVRTPPATIPNARRREVWKTPYSYGYFGASGSRSWSNHHGYRDRYSEWRYQ